MLSAMNRNLFRQLKLAKIAVTLEQCAVMEALLNNNGVSQQELCAITFKDKPSMTRLLGQLEKQELVARVVDKIDRRAKLIHTTEKGQALAEKIRELSLPLQNQALAGRTKDELALCYSVLHEAFERLAKNLK
jgi:DNA-binding MarR family transcriptional regulator